MHLFTFRKDERLSRKKSIDMLFREGRSFFIHPFKVYWIISPLESNFPAKVLVIAGKRSFKRAVDRNRIKRQVKETYRMNKASFYEVLETHDKQCMLALIYTAGTLPEIEELDRKIKLVFRRLIHELENVLNNNDRSLSE